MNESMLQWGILGAGTIAHAFAGGVARSETGRVVAIGSRSAEKAEAFGRQHGIPHRHGSYEALLADPQVQAIYVATPHTEHLPWTLAAIAAGKHVLCEKPIGIHLGQAEAMIAAARERGVFLMEAFMYRCHPQIARVIELIQSGAIGRLRQIHASFGYSTTIQQEPRLFDPAFGGGGILDVGCYPVSAARLFAGAAAGQPFLDPTDVVAQGVLGSSGVDESAAAVLRFENQVVALVSTGIRVELENTVRLYGDAGRIVIPDPWIPARDAETVHVELVTGDRSERIAVPTEVPLYGLEADAFARSLARGEAIAPAMSWEDTLGNMRTLDRWRAAIGLRYSADGVG